MSCTCPKLSDPPPVRQKPFFYGHRKFLLSPFQYAHQNIQNGLNGMILKLLIIPCIFLLHKINNLFDVLLFEFLP